MAPIATADLDYCPAPFPDNLPIIDLQKVSITELLEGDEDAARRIFDIFRTSGFFYIDLKTDPRGREFIAAANQLHDAAKDVFTNTSLEDKETWKGDPRRGFLDIGYRAMAKDENGQPNKGELLNVPSSSVLYDPTFQLPPWLAPYREQHKSFAHHGDLLGQAIFRSLEHSLHLRPGELTKMHKVSDQTGGFVRMFRYNPPKDGLPSPIPAGPAHTDSSSLTILFNWSGGLQIVRPKATGRGVQMVDAADAEEEWLWVRPIPGHVIVNLGDPMVTLTNGLLTGARHRIMTPPGEQAKFDRISVLMGMRPLASTPMRALESDVVPLGTETQNSKEAVTADDWAVAKVRGILDRAYSNKG